MPDENEWSPAEIISIRIHELRIGMGVGYPAWWHQVKERMVVNMCSNRICFGLTVRGWAHGIQDELRELLAKLLATQCVVRDEAKCLNRSPQETGQKTLKRPE
jgi:hypothetical protein